MQKRIDWKENKAFLDKTANRITAICILAALSAVSGCAAFRDFLQKPVVEFDSMEMTNLSLFQSTPIFKFKVANPNPVGMKIKKFEYDFKVNDKKFVKGVTEQGVTIGANNSRIVRLPFMIGHLDLFDSIAEFSKTRNVRYDLSGTIGFKYFSIPYHKSGELDIPELPKISLQSVNVKGLSPSGASMTAFLNMENPNPFAVKLSELDYALKLGGSEFAKGRAYSIPLIEKNGASTVSVQIDVSFANIGRSLWNILSRSSSGYELAGAMKFDIPMVGEKTFPFKKFGETPLVK